MMNYRRSRLETNVIDYRPSTAPDMSMSPQISSRSLSPVSLKSPRIAKEQIYRTILEKNEFDMDKLIQNLPQFYNNPTNGISPRVSRIIKKVPPVLAKEPPGSARAVSSRNVSVSRTPSNRIMSAPNSSRREQQSRSESRANLGVNSSSKLNSPGLMSGRVDNRDSRTVSCETIIEEGQTVELCSVPRKTPRMASKRLSICETKEIPSKKDVLLKHVFAVNGSIVAFKSCGYENFTNWFGDESMLTKEKKPEDFFHRELDTWGFTNREISMKLYCGNKLQIEGNRPARGKLPQKKIKETIMLPNHLPVEGLIICRNRAGRLIIQEIPRAFNK